MSVAATLRSKYPCAVAAGVFPGVAAAALDAGAGVPACAGAAGDRLTLATTGPGLAGSAAGVCVVGVAAVPGPGLTGTPATAPGLGRTGAGGAFWAAGVLVASGCGDGVGGATPGRTGTPASGPGRTGCAVVPFGATDVGTGLRGVVATGVVATGAVPDATVTGGRVAIGTAGRTAEPGVPAGVVLAGVVGEGGVVLVVLGVVVPGAVVGVVPGFAPPGPGVVPAVVVDGPVLSVVEVVELGFDVDPAVELPSRPARPPQ